MSTANRGFSFKGVVYSSDRSAPIYPNLSIFPKNGIMWALSPDRNEELFTLHVDIIKSSMDRSWLVEADLELKLITRQGDKVTVKRGVATFGTDFEGARFSHTMKFEELNQNYAKEDAIRFEVVIRVKKRSPRWRLRNFNDEIPELSDITLVAEDEKFHVSKVFLVTLSEHFHTLFMKNDKDSKKHEIKLNGVKKEDLQSFLELLYGENSIDDDSITGISKLADLFRAKMAIERCEEYLMEKSEMTLSQKVQLAFAYNLMNVQEHCVDQMESNSDTRASVMEEIDKMDEKIVRALREKLSSFS